MYLNDKTFLKELSHYRHRVVYVRIVALDYQENPIEQIEGKATQGSLNIDSTSSLRRTCSLTLTTQDLDINNYYWGVKNKFKLIIGLKNTINKKYPDIIWFPQGVFVITSFNLSHSSNSSTISITGKDKMCLLNGEIGGSLPASIDFGVSEYHDLKNNTTIYNKILIEDIIKEAVHTYAQEAYHKIIIKDLDVAAVELLEYRGDTPLYLFRDVKTDQFVNFTLNGNMSCFFSNQNDYEINQYSSKATLAELENKGGYYDTRVELNAGYSFNKISYIKLANNKDQPDDSNTYTVAKITYGQTAGYKLTDLIYNGELISNPGESLTSILDKIVKMLGNYEYFYDLDGNFVFQRKKTYISTSWNNIVKNEEENYVLDSKYTSAIAYNFEDNDTIISISNNPNLANLRNDFSIWGERTSISNVKIPIHYRYAIDLKPKVYRSIEILDEDIKKYNELHPDSQMKTQESVTYWAKTDDKDVIDSHYDWRELIYQMALDYFNYNQLDNFATKVKAANYDCYSEEEKKKYDIKNEYAKGATGYEQYYTDLQGFWRQLYYPEPPIEKTLFTLTNSELTTKQKELWVKGKYQKVKILDETVDRNKVVCILQDENKVEVIPFLEWMKIPYEESFKIKENSEEYNNSDTFYVSSYTDKITGQTKYIPIPYKSRYNLLKNEIYVKDEEEYIPLIKSNKFLPLEFEDYYVLTEEENYFNPMTDLSGLERNIYLNASHFSVLNAFKYFENIQYKKRNLDGTSTETYVSSGINYYEQTCEFSSNIDNHLWWSKQVYQDPSTLNFWFDFLETDSELGEFAVFRVGDRIKVLNEKTVTSIYNKEVPNLLFTTSDEWDKKYQAYSGYIPVLVNSGNLESMFNISSQGKSAKDALDEALYNYSYCVDSINLQTPPVYHLEPNTRISIKNNKNDIYGEYVVQRMSIPLTYNGTMTLTATKAPERIL